MNRVDIFMKWYSYSASVGCSASVAEATGPRRARVRCCGAVRVIKTHRFVFGGRGALTRHRDETTLETLLDSTSPGVHDVVDED